MFLKSLLSLASTLAISTSLLAGQSTPTLAGLNSTFTVSTDTQIPGAKLKPGQYNIHIVDDISDRMIVRIDSPTGKVGSTFLSILRTPLPGTSQPGVRSWTTAPHNSAALRGFTFDSGTVIEFVYPKADAAELAKLNSDEVVAVDYEASHLKSLTGLSDDEMREINLWLLSLTFTGPDDKTPAILAKKYLSPPTSTPAPALAQQNNTTNQPQLPTQVAQLETPQPLVSPARPVHQVHQAHVAATLPHTASDLPILWLVGLLSCLSALAIHLILRSSKLEAV